MRSSSAIDALVATPTLGASSQVWMMRQIVGFRRLRPHVLCWEQEHACAALVEAGIVTTSLDAPFDAPSWIRRSWRRLCAAPSGNFLGATGSEARRLAAILGTVRPRVALCHFGHTALRVLPLTTRHGIPLVAHFHGMDLSSMLRNRWYRRSLERSLDGFAGMVVVGEHQRDWLLRRGADAKRVHLIPCGAPTREFRPAQASPRARFRYITVSRLVEFKGVREVIRAFSLAGADEDELVVVGEGPERPGLEALVHDLALSRRVRFLGAQPPDVVRREMQNSNVYVQHSLDGRNGWVEGFGVSVTEAAACGLPVVATRCGGIPDQVDDGRTGYLIDQRDVEGMARAMRHLRADEAARTQLGRAARTHVQEHFDTGRQVERLEQLLVDTAHERTGDSTP